LILLVGIWSYQTALAAKMHPSYELEDFLPYHQRYHNALVGLSVHPQWPMRFGKDYFGTGGDTLGYVTGVLYLMKNYDVPESYYMSPLSATYMMRLDDRMKRYAYFQFIREHPWFVIEAHFFKVSILVSILAHETARAAAMPTTIFIALGGIAIACFLGCWPRRGHSGNGATAQARRIAVISALAVLFSWIPFVYAYPIAYATADAQWILFFALLVVGWAFLTSVASAAARALGVKDASPDAERRP
jgi:hypothetical protein